MNRRTAVLIVVIALLVTFLPGCRLVQERMGEAVEAAPQVQATAVPAATPAPLPAQAGQLAFLEGTLQAIYDRVGPSVVNIQVVQRADAGESGFGLPDSGLIQGSGSGFVWDTQGHIVSNYHVVGQAEKILVTFSDGTTVRAKLVGTDPDSDLAVVKVDRPAEQLQPVQLADSRRVKVGSLVVAIGQPFGLQNTMTVGFVSAIGRSMPTGEETGLAPSYTIPDVIQTDAPINPGNSGGVLLDSNGQVIGVTTAIISPVRASAGIGFAIPAAIVQRVVPALIATGRYEHPRIGIVGTSMTPDLAEAMGLPETQRGALVIEVAPGGPADKAGLRGSARQVEIDGEPRRVGGDVIVAIDNLPVRSFDEIVSYLANSTSVGQQVTLTVLRDGKEQEFTVTLEARPSSSGAGGQAGAASGRVWLGVMGVTLTPGISEAAGLDADQKGVLVQEVLAGSPADKAQLRGSYKPVTVDGERVLVGGDVIIAWGRERVESFEQLKAMVGAASPGEQVTLTLLRDGRRVSVRVRLEAQPGQ
ncbi:MAG: trypsin-like peptidase domain-containing protein [Anaerolineae bacterium]